MTHTNKPNKKSQQALQSGATELDLSQKYESTR